MKHQYIKRRGFTLIELLVTMSIISIVAAFTVPAYGAMRQSVGLNAATRQLVSTIREAQNKSITSQDNSSYGVRIDSVNKQYILYRNSSPTVDIQTIAAGFPISVTPNLPITFTRLTGQASAAVITIGSGTKEITITAGGLITVS